MVEPLLYIFLGSEESKKQEKISELKRRLLTPPLQELNYHLIYGDDKQLTCAALKEVLASFPVGGADKRLVVIKAAHKLDKNSHACLEEALGAGITDTVVVLDVPDIKGTEKFVGIFAKKGAQVVRFKTQTTETVFDLGRAILARRPEVALKILSGLIGEREKAEKLLGGLFWQWDHFQSERRLSEDAYAKGLKFLSEADKKLKSSVSVFAREKLVLETLIVKLSYLSR